jgi:NAD(P)-dependent dehydrogenase (short-subunit alcohol dehydrogenase family)
MSLQGSSIVFISSYTAYKAVAPIAMYAVSKTALVALSNALAEELGPEGIPVNCVAPGDALVALFDGGGYVYVCLCVGEWVRVPARVRASVHAARAVAVGGRGLGRTSEGDRARAWVGSEQVRKTEREGMTTPAPCFKRPYLQCDHKCSKKSGCLLHNTASAFLTARSACNNVLCGQVSSPQSLHLPW